MRIRLLMAGLVVGLTLAVAAPAAAQAGTNATGGGGSGCWGCFFFLGNQCYTDQPQGFWNCNWNGWTGATCSSPGCGGGGGNISVGLDGSFAYAGSSKDDFSELIRRECDGLVVARRVSVKREEELLRETAVLEL